MSWLLFFRFLLPVGPLNREDGHQSHFLAGGRNTTSAVASGNANLRDVALGCRLPQEHTTNSFRKVNPSEPIPTRLAKYSGQGSMEKDCAPGHQRKDILEVRRAESILFAVHGVHPAFYGAVWLLLSC
jgi:hypothetical protein